jgi:hypothetical protein
MLRRLRPRDLRLVRDNRLRDPKQEDRRPVPLRRRQLILLPIRHQPLARLRLHTLLPRQLIPRHQLPDLRPRPIPLPVRRLRLIRQRGRLRALVRLRLRQDPRLLLTLRQDRLQLPIRLRGPRQNQHRNPQLIRRNHRKKTRRKNLNPEPNSKRENAWRVLPFAVSDAGHFLLVNDSRTCGQRYYLRKGFSNGTFEAECNAV